VDPAQPKPIPDNKGLDLLTPGAADLRATLTKATKELIEEIVAEYADTPEPASFVDYTASFKRCEPYLRCLRVGTTGTFLSRFGPVETESLEEIAKQTSGKSLRTVKLWASFADGGHGKTYPLLQILRKKAHQRDMAFRWVCPNNSLRDETATGLGMTIEDPITKKGAPRAILDTFEGALFHTSGLVVLDEITKYPPGYLDLLLSLDPMVTHVIVLGDPTQNAWHEPNVDCVLNNQGQYEPEALHLSRYAQHFGVGTRRLAVKIATFLDMPTLSKDTRSGFSFPRVAPFGWTRIVPSRKAVDDAMTLAAVEAFTSSSSQGLTRPNIAIIINATVLSNLSYPMLWTALTRSKGNVAVVFDFPMEPTNVQRLTSHPLTAALYAMSCGVEASSPKRGWVAEMDNNRFLRSKRVLPNLPWTNLHLIPEEKLHLSHELEIPEPTAEGGRSVPDGLAPESKAYYSFLRDVEPTEAEPTNADPKFHLPHTHHARADREHFNEFLRAGVRERSERELPGDPYSQQFPDIPKRRPGHNKRFRVSPFALRDDDTYDPIYGNAFHKMTNGDSTTFAAAIKKRITLATPEENRAQFDRSSLIGGALFSSLCELLQVDPNATFPWSTEDFERKIQENEENRLKVKTLAQLNAARVRSQPEWEANCVNIIMKSEMKAKLESMHGDAKAGQTLAVFADEALFYLGPLCRYLVDRILALCPPHILIYLKCSPTKLDAFVRRYWRDVKSCTNDFTAFDQGQDGATLSMEINLMKMFSTPKPMIDYYIWLKLNVYSWLGPFGIMRFTGEFCTFLFNTLANMAFSNLRFYLVGVVCLFGGDDSAFNCVPLERPDWRIWSALLTLQAKLETTNRPVFVSWYLTSKGIYKSPTLLLARLTFHQAQGTLHRVVLSYYHEYCFAFRLSDLLYDYASESDLEAQSLLFSFFSRRKNLPRKLESLGSDQQVEEISTSAAAFIEYAVNQLNAHERSLLPNFIHTPHVVNLEVTANPSDPLFDEED
jgi:hypothetical protein